MCDQPKILLIDIETAPILASVWGLWDQNVGINQISLDWHLLSFAAKWLGDKKVFYEDQSKVKHIENDKALLVKMTKLLDEADIVVAHNGNSFDVPKLRARMILSGLKPPSTFRSIDTLKEAKKLFNFTSNKLEYLSQKLTDAPKDKHKEFPGFELWSECLAHNPRAWAEMKKYNIRDIYALEKVYIAMRPWIEGHPNLGMYVNSENPVCPKCRGHVQARGFAITNFGKYQRYQCQKCGGWSRGRTMLNSKQSRKRQLSN